MKKSLSALLVTLSIFLTSAHAIPVTADLNITTPTDFSGELTLVPDFSFDTDKYIIDSLTLSLTFSDNILDPLDNFTISYQNNKLTGSQESSLSFLPVDHLSYDVSDLLIRSLITSNILLLTNGNGVNITSISLTGNAVEVSEPAIIVLMITGLLAVFSFTRKRHNG